MTLIDPREALADQNSLISYLLGLAGLAGMVRTLAEDDNRRTAPGPADDFVHALLGIASLGDRIENLTEPAVASDRAAIGQSIAPRRWLR